MRRLLPVLGVWLFLSAVVAVGFLLAFWPNRPHSALGWTVLVLGALPLAALGEFLGDRLILHSELGASLNALGSGFGPSLLRVMYVLVYYLALAAVAGLLITALNRTGWLSAL